MTDALALPLWPRAEGEVQFDQASLADVGPLLERAHYLGPLRAGGAQLLFAGWLGQRAVAASVWRQPSSAWLPSDGTWLELVRWCLTPEAGRNAGSRMHGWTVRWLRANAPRVTTLISYSDPSVGHTGALYRACNWEWRPTWMRLRPPPSGNGRWRRGGPQQEVKDRWAFALRPDPRREEILAVTDQAAIRAYLERR